MAFTDYALYRLARNWPSPMDELNRRLGAESGTDAYEMAYAQHQFDQKVRSGLQATVTGDDVLEIGCGHGGISCYLAVAGASSVIGIDLNAHHLEYARRFAAIVSSRLGGAPLPVTFQVMSAYETTFADGSFDTVVAENAFEHFSDPEAVMREAHRVLRPRGRLLVPIFSSIYSKYGLHLKHGLKLPWANLVFSESTIIRAMRRLAVTEPRIMEWYPGLANGPQRVRDLRPHRDLNDITYHKFREMAGRCGFTIEWFRPKPTVLGWFIARAPVLRRSPVMDVFSLGAAASLRKP